MHDNVVIRVFYFTILKRGKFELRLVVVRTYISSRLVFIRDAQHVPKRDLVQMLDQGL